jgi:trk system potassium uptake protein TrkA
MRGRDRQESSRKRVAVIGLGRFGNSVARVCHALGYEVTAIDISEQRVSEAADYATLTAQADGADEETLRSLGVDRSEVGVVGQGQNIEASISCALVLKRLGVPWVIAKAETNIHGEILRRIGTDRIVFPESEAGNQVAHSLEIRHAIAYMNLRKASGVASLHVPSGSAGKSIADLEAMYRGVSILLIQRGHILSPHPAPETVLEKADIVLVAGLDGVLDAFADS